MTLNRKDLLLADSLPIYNNLATINGITGRLNVKICIYPSAFIEWEFEFFLNESVDIASLSESFNKYAFIAPIISVKNLFKKRESYNSASSLQSFFGIATKLILGDPYSRGQSFYFLLTNSKFLSSCLIQDEILYSFYEKGIVTKNLERREIASGLEGKFIDVSLGSTWNLRLEIRKEAMNWLDEKSQSIGSYLTCEAELYQSNRSSQGNCMLLECIHHEF